MIPFNSTVETPNGVGTIKEKCFIGGNVMRIVLHRSSEMKSTDKGVKISSKNMEKPIFQFWCYPESDISLVGESKK